MKLISKIRKKRKKSEKRQRKETKKRDKEKTDGTETKKEIREERETERLGCTCVCVPQDIHLRSSVCAMFCSKEFDCFFFKLLDHETLPPFGPALQDHVSI